MPENENYLVDIRHMALWLKIGGAPLGGMLLYFSQDHPVLLPLVFIAFISLFYSLGTIRKTGIRLLCIALFAAAYILANFSYLIHAAANGSWTGLILAIIPWTIYMIPMTPAAFCKRYVVEAFVFAWLLGEIIFVRIPIGNSYLVSGTPLSYIPEAIQWYRYSGPFGGSIWVVGLSYLIYRAVIKKDMSYWLVALGISLPVLCSLLIFRFTVTDGQSKERTVAIVSLKAGSRAIDSILQQNNAVTCDYILSPEAISAVPRSSLSTHPTFTALRRSLRDSLRNCTVFTGVFLTMPDRTVSNSVVTYARDRATQIRNKQRFIPFGEYLPCRNILGKIEWINNAVPYDLTATPNRSEIIRIDGDGISPLICYEGIFWDDMCRYCRQGAEIFFISASNEIVDNMHCEKQILNISRANAITTDRSIVRAVQNGLSYAVDNRGRVLAFCDNADSMVVQNVELTSKQTFYTKHYRRIEYLYGFLFIGGIGWCMTAAGKSEKTGPSDFSKGPVSR